MRSLRSLRELAEHEGSLLVLIVLLLAVAHGTLVYSLSEGLASAERVESFRSRGFEVREAEVGRLVVARPGRTPGSEPVVRDVGREVLGGRGLAFLPAFGLLALAAGAAMAGVHRGLRLRSRDPVLFPLMVLLCGLGILVVTRLAVDVVHAWPARFPEALGWPRRQAAAALLAAFLVPVTALAATGLERLDWLQKPLAHRVAGLPLYTVFPALACALLLWTGIAGETIYGARLSLRLGGATLQVVELVKPLLVLYAAYLLADLERRGEVQERLVGFRPRSRRALCGLLCVGAVVSAIAFLGTRDLGLVLICAGFLVLAPFVGTGEGWLGAGAAAGAALAGAAVAVWRHPAYVYERFAALADPFQFGETLARVRWSLAAGGVFGAGPGRGMPHSVPNADSDLVLAAVAEEWGLVGVTLALGGLACLLYRGLVVARREEEPFRKHLAAGVCLLLLLQTVVIVAGTLGVLPLTGLPLPFVSRGGVGLVVNAVLLGLLIQVSFVPPRGTRPVPPYAGRWHAVNRRLRVAAFICFGCLGLLWGRTAWLMTAAAERDAARPFVDVEKIRVVEHLSHGGALRAEGGRVRFDAGRLGTAAEGLPPHLRRRVSVAGGSLDGRNLGAVAAYLGADGEGRVIVPPGTFTVTNPRTLSTAAFELVDRKGRLLAGPDPRRGRRYPLGEEGFPVTGHGLLGAPLFLEADAARLVRRVREGAAPEALWRQVFERARSLLGGEPVASSGKGPTVVRVSIDAEVQRVAMGQLEGLRGAAVVLLVPEGDVLALASRPSFDPDQPVDRAQWDRAFSNPELRLSRHRALHVRYQPGSLMKLVTGAALLELRREHAEAPLVCGGEDTQLGVRDYGSEHSGGGHGRIGFERALARSCNVYFARAAVTLQGALQEMGRRLGFGEEISLLPWDRGADLTAAPSHLLTCYTVSGSGPEPPECVGTEPWSGLPVGPRFLAQNPKLVARAGFGQTVVEATPLQMALTAAAVAGGGRMPQPRLVLGVETRRPDGAAARLLEVPERGARVFSGETADRLRRAMEAAWTDGTARPEVVPLRLDRAGGAYALRRRPAEPVRVAAKTGTAEVQGAGSHAWFAAFAPAESPRVVVLVLVEHGGSGGRVAGPRALTILQAALRALQ